MVLDDGSLANNWMTLNGLCFMFDSSFSLPLCSASYIIDWIVERVVSRNIPGN